MTLLRQGRKGPRRTFRHRAWFQIRRPLIMRPLQFSLRVCATEGWCALQWYYFLQVYSFLRTPTTLTSLGTQCEMSPLRGIERESAKIGLAINEGKTKYMLSASEIVRRMASHIKANSYNFDVVKEFIYLGNDINTNKDVNLKIKRKLALANRC